MELGANLRPLWQSAEISAGWTLIVNLSSVGIRGPVPAVAVPVPAPPIEAPTWHVRLRPCGHRVATNSGHRAATPLPSEGRGRGGVPQRGGPQRGVCKEEAIRKMEPAWEKVQGLKFELLQKSYDLLNGGRKLVPYYSLTKTECLYIATKFNDEAWSQPDGTPLPSKGNFWSSERQRVGA